MSDDDLATRRAHLGPFESWLADLLDAALAGNDLGAIVASVDVSAGSKLGEARALLALPGPHTPDRAAWRRLADLALADPAIERAVVVPPTIYVTLAAEALERGVAEGARAERLIARRPDAPGVVAVFCSPNTNKALHIGHLRACFLGMAISRLFEATGIPVARSQMLSNFGIHMCQALAAHDGVTTPASAGIKGDHFVGDLYRAFHEATAAAPDAGCDQDTCRAGVDGHPCLRCRASRMLRGMAGGDPELLAANRRLGEWAIEGILATQARVGTHHDVCLRESETLPVAIAALNRAVDEGICLQRPDGSTYIPVRSTGEAELTLLRRDGTSLVFSMLLGVYLSRESIYPGWQVAELTGEQWRAGRTAMYEVLRRVGREDISEHTEGVFFGMVQVGGRVLQSRAGGALTADGLLDRTADRVEDWAHCPPSRRDDPQGRDRVASALLKYHVLSFARDRGFDFDEDGMWEDSTTRVGNLLHALAWADAAASAATAPPPHPAARQLALALARQSSVATRALTQRDPGVLVRHVDDIVGRAIAASGAPTCSPRLASATARALRQSVHLLGIDPGDLGLAG